VNGLRRTLGPVGASAIGVASMVGAGVFYVFAPATQLAGSWVLVSLVIAGSLALLNALSMAQLSVHNPVAGGAYSFAHRYVSPRVGFLAGWLFLAGKTSSVAAIAVIAGSYVSAEFAAFIAAGFVVVFAGVNISGIRTTAWVSMAIAVVVVGTLLALAGASVSQGSFSEPTGGSVWGVFQAAGLLFFAFAGYARMSTLGEEVKNPTRVLPRVIIGTLLGVLGLYALVGGALLWVLGPETLAGSLAPVADLAPDAARAFVVGVAVLASLGSVMTVLAGLSRVTLAMARDNAVPKTLSWVWPRTGSPVRAEALVAGVAVLLVFWLDPLVLVGASAGSVLLYYGIAHWSALSQPRSERLLWRFIPWCGLVGCVVVVATLPPVSVLTTVVLAGSGLLYWQLRVWRSAPPR
jgi:APA family basic amino acid/polyamine antiporter